MTLVELIEEIERLKRRQRFDQALAESAPLVASNQDVKHVNLDDVIRRVKQRGNRLIIETLRKHFGL